MQTDHIEAIWGAIEIGKVINAGPRRTFYLLEKGLLPARKIGGVWQSTRGELRDLLLGIAPADKHTSRKVA
jgi:hypothetical protein